MKVDINIAPVRGFSARLISLARLIVICLSFVFILTASVQIAAQNPPPGSDAPKKVNTRPVSAATSRGEPFDDASIEKMASQCVTLDTEQGVIVIEMLPAKAPESARSFLNLAATGLLNTTTFSRVLKGFVIQGG